MQLTYAPDEPQLFLLREKSEDPQIEPHARIKMAQGMVSLVYICGGYTRIALCDPPDDSGNECEARG